MVLQQPLIDTEVHQSCLICLNHMEPTSIGSIILCLPSLVAFGKVSVTDAFGRDVGPSLEKITLIVSVSGTSEAAESEMSSSKGLRETLNE